MEEREVGSPGSKVHSRRAIRVAVFLAVFGLALASVAIARHVRANADSAAVSDTQRTVYACPMHPEKQFDEPGRCADCGMNLIPVQAAVASDPPQVVQADQHGGVAAKRPTAAPSGDRKILYWYDPMHPQYRSDKSGTAPDCGMDLVPKYADETESETNGPPGTVKISPLKQQLIGVRTTPVSRRTLTRDIHTVGVIQADETGIRKVHTKFPGWVDQVFVNATGQPIRAGEPILSIYSPDLVSTQAEYLLALRGHRQLRESAFPEAAQSAKSLLDATRRRLRLWDITPQQIRALEESGRPQTNMTLHSPVSGYVTVKDVYQGLYVTPEMELYTVTDLSRVWAMLDVYEYEMRDLQVGVPVTLTLSYYPGQPFKGTVSYVYPYLDPKTRTNKVRVQLENADLRLKPDMYADAQIHVPSAEGLAIPEDAVLDSGTKQVAFVATGDGYFQPRELHLGQRADGYVEVLQGVSEGEQVVVGANFMIDSESQLKAALGAMGGMPGMPGMEGASKESGARSQEPGEKKGGMEGMPGMEGEK